MRALLNGEVEYLDFIIAQDLGMTLTEVRNLPHSEIVEWRAYYAVQKQKQDLESLKAKHFK